MPQIPQDLMHFTGPFVVTGGSGSEAAVTQR